MMGIIEAGQAALENGGDRQPRHMNLHGAINDMQGVLMLMEELLNDINPRPSSNTDEIETKPSPPTLSDILNNGPDRIRNSCDRMRTLINELREELF